jgi:8-oxo-dGTP pyrophosphatase MutT (NUDIX family)
LTYARSTGPPDRSHVLARLAGTAAPVDPAQAALAGLATPFAAALAAQADAPSTPAAVLIALLERSCGRLDVVLTERAVHLKHHPGQVSFPGGRIERGDGGPIAAALREAYEEIGLSPMAVEVVGFLDAQLTVSGYAVTPVVGLVNERSFKPVPDPAEVAAIFAPPLAFFLDERNRATGLREYRGSTFEVVEYHWEGRRIWGATARMLQKLSIVLNEINNI